MPIILHLRHKSKTYYKQVYFGRFFQNSKSLTLAHSLLYELQYQTRGSWSYCQQQKHYIRKSKFFKEYLLYIYIVGICLINKGENVTKNSNYYSWKYSHSHCLLFWGGGFWGEPPKYLMPFTKTDIEELCSSELYSLNMVHYRDTTPVSNQVHLGVRVLGLFFLMNPDRLNTL